MTEFTQADNATPVVPQAAPPPAPEPDFSWLDDAVEYASQPAESPPAPQRQVIPPPLPSEQIRSARELTNEELVREFVKGPKEFVRGLWDEIATEMRTREIEPIKQMLGGFMQHMHSQQVQSAMSSAVGKLKEIGRAEPALQQEPVRREVAGIYMNLIQMAAQGNQWALNTLKHPLMPVYAVDMAKRTAGSAGSPGAPAPAVSYQGGRVEAGSLVSGGAPQQLNDAEMELARRWGITPEQFQANKSQASR